MNAEYLLSFLFSTSSLVWSIYGLYTDVYGAGLLLYALSYFAYELYTCIPKNDYQYVIHGALGATGIMTAFWYGPTYYKYVYDAITIFEASTPLLNIARNYRTMWSFQAFASAFFFFRIIVASYFYITQWIYIATYLSSCMMFLQYYWWMKICAKYIKLKEKAD